MISKRLCTLCVSVLLITFGIFFIICSTFVFEYITRTQLVLSPDSKTYKSWVQLPALLPMDIYLFNWTNPEELYTPGAKPKFEQVGPYRFMMDLKKVNVTWNQNGTVTYKSQKFWYFSSMGTNGSLQDTITTLNTPALGAAHMAQSWGFFLRKGISIILSKHYSNISVTRTIEELLFKGYPDALTAMSSSDSLFFTPPAGVPKWDKFGLFYKRNGTIDYENPYNIGTGRNSTFAKVYNWNYWNETPYYQGECGKVEGSCGDSFNASGDSIQFFMPDVCRYLVLQYVGDTEVDGIIGRKYVLDDHSLDNGTKYPQNKCFNVGDVPPSGVFNLSSCRYGSPAFMSLPHFYQADPYYNDLVDGLQPDKEKHEFSMIIEPRTGIPLQANVKMQLNMLLHSVRSITLFEDAPEIFFPVMWFQQRGSVPKDQLPMLKLLLRIPTISLYSGIFMLMIGLGLVVLIAINMFASKRKKFVQNLEENVPLKLKHPGKVLRRDI